MQTNINSSNFFVCKLAKLEISLYLCNANEKQRVLTIKTTRYEKESS